MYKPTSFTIHELVHPQIIQAIGDNNSWRRLDEECLRDLQKIRDLWHDKYKSGIYVNRIDFGIDSRGLRPPNDPDGSFYSSHKMGKAFDLEPVNGDNEALYLFVVGLIGRGELIKINTVEDNRFTPTWTHIASMNTDNKPLIITP